MQPPSSHDMKEMTIKRATILDAPLEALHELILLPNPATEPKVVSGEGVDQHLATIHYVEKYRTWPLYI